MNENDSAKILESATAPDFVRAVKQMRMIYFNAINKEMCEKHPSDGYIHECKNKMRAIRRFLDSLPEDKRQPKIGDGS